jgi:hypothetical protein
MLKLKLKIMISNYALSVVNQCYVSSVAMLIFRLACSAVGSFRFVGGDTQLDHVANVYTSFGTSMLCGCVGDAVASCILNYCSCVYLCFSCTVFVQRNAGLSWCLAYISTCSGQQCALTIQDKKSISIPFPGRR